MKIGFQLSSIQDRIHSPGDVSECFTKIRRIGYRYVQIQYLSPEIRDDEIEINLMRHSLHCVGTQDDYPGSLAQMDRILEKNRLWNSGYVCSALWPEQCVNPAGYMNFPEYARFTEEMDEAGKKVLENGMIFTYHPLFFDFAERDGVIPLDYLLSHTKSDIQVTLDLYHVIRAGLDPVETIRKYKGNMDIVHFKDSIRRPGQSEEMMPLGQGDTDWDPIVRACVEAGVKYCFVEQESCGKDSFECMAESYRYLEPLVRKYSEETTDNYR